MQANKRGQMVAIGGLVLQLGLIGLAVWLRLGQAPAALPALWLIAAPVPMWLLTVILFYSRFLQRREEAELAELAARPGAESIFIESEDKQVHVAANRVRWLERWLVPVFTLLLAAYHIGLGVLLVRVAGSGAGLATMNLAGGFFVALGGAFLAFLFSRYSLGMAKVEVWQLLRAPGSYVSASAVAFLLLAAVMAAEYFQAHGFGRALGYILPVFMIVVGAELVLNFILDLYRPKVPGAERRFSYDSRLLNLIAAPEGIGHSIADALNYQFGFEVSSTWFYQLLQKAFVPLILCGAAIVWLLTSVVVVKEGDSYVVLHLGKYQRILEPRAAPYLLWPWPINVTRKFETGKIHQITLGVGTERKVKVRSDIVRGKQINLWTAAHGDRHELDMLVAMKPREKRPSKDVPSMAIVKLVVSVYYRIDDPYKFGFNHRDTPRLLEDIAHGQLVKYAACATLDEPLEGQASLAGEAIMTTGRDEATVELRKRIAEAAGELGLGVKILRVELLGCHPPVAVAEAFENVAAAEREQDRKRYEAEAKAKRILAQVAGDPDEALAIAQEIDIMYELSRLVNVRSRGGDLPAAVTELIRSNGDKIEKLKEEITLERLLGRLSPDGLTPAQRLLKRRQDHVKLLEAMGRDLAKYDLKAVQTEHAAQRRLVNGLFATIQGRAAVVIAQARADRWETEFAEVGRALTFESELLGYRAAPEIYWLDRYLTVLTKGLEGKRKYVIGVDRSRVEVWMDAAPGGQSITDLRFGASDK